MSNYVAATMEEAIHTIRNSSIENLSSPNWLEHKLLPYVGITNAAKDYIPEWLHPFCGSGLEHFQSPNQFSKYLAYISKQKINNYIEIGTLAGGTFILTVEYLSRFNSLTKAVAVDLTIYQSIKNYASINPIVDVIEASSDSKSSEELFNQNAWDLVFIDADHNEEPCFNDYQRFVNNARIIAFHDTYNDVCPGVGRVWERLRSVFPARMIEEFHEQYVEILQKRAEKVFGIGLINFESA